MFLYFREFDHCLLQILYSKIKCRATMRFHVSKRGEGQIPTGRGTETVGNVKIQNKGNHPKN